MFVFGKVVLNTPMPATPVTLSGFEGESPSSTATTARQSFTTDEEAESAEVGGQPATEIELHRTETF